MRVSLETPAAAHESAFLEAVGRSGRLHHPWVTAPGDAEAFRRFIDKPAGGREVSFLVMTPNGEMAGVVNLNEIVRGVFKSAYLGYYAFSPFAGKGAMTAGLRALMRRAFGPLGLHRLEANIQPENRASIALVRRVGFRLEGFSPRYLKIGGRWRDHERWAITREDFRKVRT
jgi:ribosomal-protein-alanine N-acetyltransferase